MMTINLSNDVASNTPRIYGDSIGRMQFEVDDKFKFFAKYDSNNSGLDLSASSSDLIFYGDLREIGSEVDSLKATIPLICTDRTFNLLNRIGWANYKANDSKAPNGQGWTAPLMVQDVIKQRASTNRRAKSQDELIYDNEGHITPSSSASSEFLTVDARLASQGGFIQDDRSVTLTKNGTQVSRTIGTPDSVNSLFPTVPISTRNYNFPFRDFALSGKPIYEMLQNLSQIDMTNTENELDADNTSFNIIIQRAMRYHFDELNRFHWFYPIDNTFAEVDSSGVALNTNSTDKAGNDLDLVMGVDNIYHIKNHKLKFALFELINFIYFEAGKDMNGDAILGFRYDPTSGAPTIKDSRRNYASIAQKMKQADSTIISDGQFNPNGHITPDAAKLSGYAYPADYGDGISPLWDPQVTVKSNAEYNLEFKKEARRRGNARADSIIRGTSSQRWKGPIEIRFHNLTVNDLIRFTSKAGNIYQEKLRINEINHHIQKSGAFTTLSVEADGKELKA